MNLAQRHDNRLLLAKLSVVVVAMFGFGYALVPFYEKICEVTGLRDIARADDVANTQVDASREVRIEFDSNIRKLPWQFRALTPVVDVHPGELRFLEIGFDPGLASLDQAEISGAAAHVTHHHTHLALSFGEHHFGRGQRVEHKLRHFHPGQQQFPISLQPMDVIAMTHSIWKFCHIFISVT